MREFQEKKKKKSMRETLLLLKTKALQTIEATALKTTKEKQG